MSRHAGFPDAGGWVLGFWARANEHEANQGFTRNVEPHRHAHSAASVYSCRHGIFDSAETWWLRCWHLYNARVERALCL